jgi:hypothetical protein
MEPERGLTVVARVGFGRGTDTGLCLELISELALVSHVGIITRMPTSTHMIWIWPGNDRLTVTGSAGSLT